MRCLRLISSFLALILAFTLVPATVMAEERVDVAAVTSSAYVEAVEGEEAIVVVTISNLGPIPATKVMFEFEKQGASVTISQGVCYEGRHPRAGQCDVGTMAVGQTVTVTYKHRGVGSQVIEFGAWSDDLNDINRRNNYVKMRIAYRNPFDPPVSVRESTAYTPPSLRPMLGELQYYRTYTSRRVTITTGRNVELRWDYQALPFTGGYPSVLEWIPRDIFLIGAQWQLQIWQNVVSNSGYNVTREIGALQRLVSQANQYPSGTRVPEYLKYKPDCKTVNEACWTDQYRQQVANEQAAAPKPPPPIWGNNAKPVTSSPVQPSAPPAPPVVVAPASPPRAPVPTPPIPSAPPNNSFTSNLQLPTVFSFEGSALSVVNESQDGIQYDAKVYWQQYGDFMAAHPTMRATVGQAIDFATGMDTDGDLPLSEIYVNAALTALPIGELVKPAVVLVKYGTGWVIKVGDYVVAKIIGGSAENITKKIIGERMLERIWGRIGVTLEATFKKSAQGFDNVGRMGNDIVIGEAKYMGGTTGNRVFSVDDLGKNRDKVIQMTEPWVRKVLERMKKTMENLVNAISAKLDASQVKLHLIIVRESGKVGGVSDAVKKMFHLIMEVDTYGNELMRYTR